MPEADPPVGLPEFTVVQLVQSIVAALALAGSSAVIATAILKAAILFLIEASGGVPDLIARAGEEGRL